MEWPLVVAALTFLGAYSWQVIGAPTGTYAQLAMALVIITWLVFVIDYVVNLWLAEDRWAWFRHHLFDLAVIALPLLRPLRVLRAITVLHILNRTVGTAVRGKILIYTASASHCSSTPLHSPSSTPNAEPNRRSIPSPMRSGGPSSP